MGLTRDDGEINDREDSQQVKMKREEQLGNKLNERQLGFYGNQGTKTHIYVRTLYTEEKNVKTVREGKK